MRRADKEITERQLIDSIIHQSLACRIALCDGKMPYVIPMSFGYDGKNIYLHSAKEGRKIEILKGNPLVCFEFETDCEVIPTPRACSFTMRYKSVIGYGTACFIDDIEERSAALRTIISQYTDKIVVLSENDLAKITIIRIDCVSGFLTSSRKPYSRMISRAVIAKRLSSPNSFIGDLIFRGF